MRSVSVSRTFDASADELVARMTDVERFTRAAGFDEVTVDGDDVRIANHVGLLTIELDLRLVDDPDHALVYEQTNGVFASMVTRYDIAEDDGTTVTATTEFELDVGLVGPILDATIVKRQRRTELASQFDYLADAADGRDGH